MPQIESTDMVIMQQCMAVTGESDLTGLQDVPIVGDGQRLIGVLLDEQDGGTASVNLPNDVEDLLDQFGRQP
jgi:hypothetical protein